ncbi:uncharacterized protein [Typha angustifolia]|uniref:uncharacterized protein n=1 Tax=Typha angustifolia TaxID=59011 RepID=UPI003C2F5FBB
MQSFSPLFPIIPLDGIDGYQRWKESVLLRLRTLHLAYVLFDARPRKDDDAAASKRWDDDDALCRGHILHTLSDRLFSIHVHRPTAANLWLALERTYEVLRPNRWAPRLIDFEFAEDKPILEELARFESVAANEVGKFDDELLASIAWKKLPPPYDNLHNFLMGKKNEAMAELWTVLRIKEASLREWEESEDSEMSTVESHGILQDTAGLQRRRRRGWLFFK